MGSLRDREHSIHLKASAVALIFFFGENFSTFELNNVVFFKLSIIYTELLLDCAF